jgi:hypothetical protein
MDKVKNKENGSLIVYNFSCFYGWNAGDGFRIGQRFPNCGGAPSGNAVVPLGGGG